MDRLQPVLNRLPDFMDVDSANSKIKAIIKAITDELALYDEQADYVNSMLSIDGAVGTDIDMRFGKMFNIPRIVGEDDDLYRNRLKLSIGGLAGGTLDSLRYAIAVALNINNDVVAMYKRIDVMDAWDYTGDVPVTKTYGYVVCIIDLDGATYTYRGGIEEAVQKTVDINKAAGVTVQCIFTNYRIYTYTELDNKVMTNLLGMKFNQIGA